jgi:hypothetical protein
MVCDQLLMLHSKGILHKTFSQQGDFYCSNTELFHASSSRTHHIFDANYSGVFMSGHAGRHTCFFKISKFSSFRIQNHYTLSACKNYS